MESINKISLILLFSIATSVLSMRSASSFIPSYAPTVGRGRVTIAETKYKAKWFKGRLKCYFKFNKTKYSNG